MDTCFFILQGVPEDLLFFYEHLRKGGGQGLYLHPLQWNSGDLTTGLLGKSLS